MKKITPYKVLIILCIIAMFLGIGFTATRFAQYRQESEQAIAQLQYDQETQRQNIARDIVSTLLQAQTFNAETVYVYDFKNEEVLFEKNTDTPQNMASFAKIILTRMILGSPLVDTDVCMTEIALAAINDQGFGVGECYGMNEALKAMLISSSNDLATAIGNQAADMGIALDEYIDAQDLDMVIYDPSGYDFRQPEQASRGYAHDIAIAAYNLLKNNPDIAEATAQKDYTLGEVTVNHTYPNVENIPGLRFAKTGYTLLAGGNMMGIIEPQRGTLIGVVVMNSGFDTRFEDFELITNTLQSAYRIIR